MVQKRFFHDQRDGCFETPSREPKRINSLQTTMYRAVRDYNGAHTLCGILEPFIRKVVGEETRLVVSKLFGSSSSTSVNEAGPSAGCSLQLIFANKLPNMIFTNNILKAEDGSPLKVVLCCPNSKTVVESDPLSSAKVDIVVLTGFLPIDKEDWTEEEFNSKILRAREGKRPLIAGNQTIVLKNGVGLIRDISITDNSSWIPNKRFILGAKISLTNSGKHRVREAISHPFSVKDNRGEVYVKHYPPRSHDEVWRLEKIRKDGKIHERLTLHKIFTVKDFLLLNAADQPKLRQILGLGGMHEKMWRKIVDHAKTCNIDDHPISKHPNGCHGALEDLNLPAYLNAFDGQRTAEPASNYQQVDPFIAPNLAFQQLEPTIIHPQEGLQIQAPMTNPSNNQEDATYSIFQMPNTDKVFASALGTGYMIEDCTFLYETPRDFPTTSTMEQENILLLPSPSFAADTADRGNFSSFLDPGHASIF